MPGGIVSGVANLFGANEAAEAQRDAARMQRRSFQESLDLIRPQIETGDEARGLVGAALGLEGEQPQQQFFSDFETDPGFQESVDFGVDQLERSGAARGLSLSGGLATEVADFSRNALGTAFNNRINQLMQLASGGQGAAQLGAQLGTQSGAQQAQNIGQAGMLQGAGISGLGRGIGSAGSFGSDLAAFGGNFLSSSSSAPSGAPPLPAQR